MIKKAERIAASSQFGCCTNFTLDADDTPVAVVELIFPGAHTFRSRNYSSGASSFIRHNFSVSLWLILFRIDWIGSRFLQPVAVAASRPPHSTECLISRYQSLRSCVCVCALRCHRIDAICENLHVECVYVICSICARNQFSRWTVSRIDSKEFRSTSQHSRRNKV